MKYIPILYQTIMVQSILKDLKTMTRRLKDLQEFNKEPDQWEYVRFYDGHAKFWEKHNAVNEKYVKCPYGQPGDVLWVRETWQTVDTYPEPDCFGQYLYKANGDTCETWRPSIFMPKDACRIFLEVTDVTVERLHNISGGDCEKEGISGNILEFQDLWTKINGADSWEANPWVWVISFKKVERPENLFNLVNNKKSCKYRNLQRQRLEPRTLTGMP